MAQEYAIAADHDNEAGLDTWEDIRVSGRALTSSVQGLGTFDRGLERAYLDGSIEDTGTASWTWTIATMTLAEYAYLSTTYLNGVRSGPVTARTRTEDGSYANFNVTATLQKGPTMVAGHYEDVEIKFTSGEAL
jgi:hypothetical protein